MSRDPIRDHLREVEREEHRRFVYAVVAWIIVICAAITVLVVGWLAVSLFLVLF